MAESDEVRSGTRPPSDLIYRPISVARSPAQLLLERERRELHVFYLWLPSPDLAVARVRLRVKAGGHDVPDEVIRRRFWRSLVNFDRIYRPLSDTWRLYDGSVTNGRPLIAHGRGADQPAVRDAKRWLQVRHQIEEHVR